MSYQRLMIMISLHSQGSISRQLLLPSLGNLIMKYSVHTMNLIWSLYVHNFSKQSISFMLSVKCLKSVCLPSNVYSQNAFAYKNAICIQNHLIGFSEERQGSRTLVCIQWINFLRILQNQALPVVPGKITGRQMKMTSPRDVFIQSA